MCECTGGEQSDNNQASTCAGRHCHIVGGKVKCGAIVGSGDGEGIGDGIVATFDAIGGATSCACGGAPRAAMAAEGTFP